MIMEFIVIEKWKDLEFPSIKPLYEISTTGKVRRKEDKRPIAISYSEKGYAMVSLASTGKRRQITKKLHRLVAYSFLSKEKFDYMTVNHINGDKTDNSILNLEYVSFDYNIRHSYNTGLNTPRKGSLNGMNKFTEQDIERTCELLTTTNLSAPKILKQMESEGRDISIHIIHDLKRGKVWKHISKEYGL